MSADELVGHEPEIVELAQRLPWKPLADDRRRRLAAEVMAQADVAVVRSRRRGWAIAVGAVALAASLAIVVGLRRGEPTAAPRIASAQSPERVDMRAHATERVEAPPAEPESADGHGVVHLDDGEVTIDTRMRGPVTIVAGDTRVTITSSRATVVARKGVIVTAQVFAGTAQIEAAGETRIVEAGEVWTPTPAASSLQLFRTGYEALRAGRFAEAIAAFDRATDPVVVEDAQFWAAIAAERAGDREDAARRLRAFMDAFPASPRLDDARSALERVTR